MGCLRVAFVLVPSPAKTLYTYAHLAVAGRSAQWRLQIDNRAHADPELPARDTCCALSRGRTQAGSLTFLGRPPVLPAYRPPIDTAGAPAHNVSTCRYYGADDGDQGLAHGTHGVEVGQQSRAAPAGGIGEAHRCRRGRYAYRGGYGRRAPDPRRGRPCDRQGR